MIPSLPLSAEGLLAELETKTHHERMQRMVAIGRLAAEGRADAERAIAELQQSTDAYARFLAVQSAFGSRDGQAVLLALQDASRSVRGAARHLVPYACSDEQVAEAMVLVGPRGALVSLCTKLRQKRRDAAIDGGMERLLAKDSAPGKLLIDVIPFASERVVREQLPRLQEAAGYLGWSRMARWHPALTADELTSRLHAQGSVDPRLQWRIGGTLERIARYAPDAALRLANAILAAGDIPEGQANYLLGGSTLRALSIERPTETFDLLRARHERARPRSPDVELAPFSLTACAHRLGAERLAYVVEHAWTSLADGTRARRWFLRLNPEERRAVQDAWLERGRGAWGAFLLRGIDAAGPRGELRERAFTRWSHAARDARGVIDRERIDALPTDLRVREAQRHLADVPALATAPRERIGYARFLPFADAKTALAPWLGHPEGDERGIALAALIACVRHEPDAMPLALELVHARKFEQDPVRRAMMGALAELPVSRWRSEHLAMLGAILQDALDAADLSYATAAAVQTLVVRLFPLDARWGGAWLTKLLEARGSVSGSGLGDQLTKAQIAAMVEPLGELASAWATQERAGALIWLASSFGRKLSSVGPLIGALVRLTRELPFVHVAATALQLLRKHAPRHFGELMDRLIVRDPSFVTVPAVAHWLGWHRQDLLGRFLSNERMKGRFASGRTHWVIDFGNTHRRWTSRQQARYAEALSALAKVPKQDVSTQYFALHALARLAYAPAHHLIALASDPSPPMREIAVRRLPWLDSGQGVPELLACLADDRARWAIYALRVALRDMPEERVLAILRDAPMTKVTVAKEVMRLLGELGGEPAYRALLAMDRPGVHRDVRIALLRALWDHLERPDTWRLFEAAATDPDWIIASRLADIPLDRLSASSEMRICALLALVLGRPEPEARLDLLRRMTSLPLRDPDRVLFHQCLRHFAAAHPDEGAAACRAALVRMLPDEVDAVISAVAAQSGRRPILSALVESIANAIHPHTPARTREVAEGVLEHLARDGRAVRLYLRLATPLLGYQELAAALIALGARDGLHADALVLAQSAARACRDPDLLEALLAREASADLRRIALEALRTDAGPGRGWTDERRARLLRYRADEAPMVAEAAQFTFLPDECVTRSSP
ncbi:hypothetical protein [Pendulispora albinea]|uniref:HEAT repeat protein n=1 Tax=Pendulispora albinea TaxID=2741071 RepID=A0ABZ2M687_9BACT